jgi:hypothetical protein
MKAIDMIRRCARYGTGDVGLGLTEMVALLRADEDVTRPPMAAHSDAPMGAHSENRMVDRV